MKWQRLWTWMLGFCLLGNLAGCGSKETSPDDGESGGALSDLGASGDRSTADVKLTSVKNTQTENLELRLKVGDRFPLIKTVEQRLKQLSSKGGPPTESSSLLTLTMAIQVEEIRDGVKKLGVQYQRVRYEHDIAGEKIRYDSAVIEKSLPEAAQVYQGLANNGFSFLLSADNRIIKVLEFDAFLKKCVRHAPTEQQNELLTRLVASTEDEGIANFVDDSIGLLPYNVDSRHAGGSVKVGDTWRKTRQIVRPIPLTIDTRYRLESLNERYANVELLGQIMPAKIEQVGNHSLRQAVPSEKMTLRDGHCFGSSVIDRESGLPIQSRVVRNMNMMLELPNGAMFNQQKEITTTIRAFPQQQQAGGTAFNDPDDATSDVAPVVRSRSSQRDTNVAPAAFER